MIDTSVSQPLLTSPSDRRDAIAPGLLRVLQQAAVLRFVLSTLAVSIFLIVIVDRLQIQSPAWLPALLLLEGVAYLGLVTWPRARLALGQRFLPVALGWFMLASLVVQALPVLALPTVMLEHAGRNRLPGIDAVLLAVPIILATWQYGRRGWIVSLAGLALGQVMLALLMRQDMLQTGIYLVSAVGNLAMITLLGYVVMQLVGALRKEHQTLATANRQLAQRAATVEQLAESRERNRLARELHDTLAHSLTGISVQLQAIETLMQFDPQAGMAQLKAAQATVRSGIHESRRAIQALRASPLEDLGLSEALRQLCTRQAERTEVALNCGVADIEALDPLTEQAVYRVAEAALANAEQHSAASQVWVSLARATPAGGLRLEIRDNGAGFDRSAVSVDRYGLTGMAEWAELVGGDLRIETAPGQGTLVALEIKT